MSEQRGYVGEYVAVRAIRDGIGVWTIRDADDAETAPWLSREAQEMILRAMLHVRDAHVGLIQPGCQWSARDSITPSPSCRAVYSTTGDRG